MTTQQHWQSPAAVGRIAGLASSAALEHIVLDHIASHKDT
eukprot:CAMPEP_0114685238 /NCGR_PEP_ID=MMETSP0191-20121206/60209_1 /TAXON_ID=126664 /ORGANISM="Sorites sp." /LENGTH=39 /DNA_ID= /DNA_START= /DNA_END= /DNA_ORIENTATION=